MTLVAILLLAGVTFTTRYLFLEARLPLRLGSNIKQLLSYSGPAVLTAILIPILVLHENQLHISISNAYLWGGIVAVVAAYKTASVYWTIALGTVVFVCVSLIL